MKVQVGIVGMKDTTVTMYLYEGDAEVQNMTKKNWKAVALAIVRRKLKTAVFPISIAQPEWDLHEKIENTEQV